MTNDSTQSSNTQSSGAQSLSPAKQAVQSDKTVSTATNPQGLVTEVKAEGGSVQYKDVGRYRIEIIREKCISAASCVAIAPQVFDLDEENIAIFVENLSSQTSVDDNMTLLAAQSCPTAAIVVIDRETGKQVWPV